MPTVSRSPVPKKAVEELRREKASDETQRKRIDKEKRRDARTGR